MIETGMLNDWSLIRTGYPMIDAAVVDFYKWLYMVVGFKIYYDAKKRVARFKRGEPIL